MPEVGGSSDTWGADINNTISSIDTELYSVNGKVDTITTDAVKLAGNVGKPMSGALILVGDPTAPTTNPTTDPAIYQAATRNYVDKAISGVKASAGLQLSGNDLNTPITGGLYYKYTVDATANALILVNKGYVDTQTLLKSGNTTTALMTGPLYLQRDPTSTDDGKIAATKNYVDTKTPSLSNVSTDITMAADKTISLGKAPTQDVHAATKKYVDDAVKGATPSSLTNLSVTTQINGGSPGNGLSLSVYCSSLTAGSEITLQSDERIKEDIRTIEGATGIVEQLRGVSYVRKDTGKLGIGVVAQEVEKVLPQLVATDANGIKSVAYANMVGVLIQAVKELSARVEELEAR